MRNCLLFTVFLNIFLLGCTVGPKYVPPCMNIPDDWQSPLPDEIQRDPPDCFLWWESLNDPILNSLIERTASQNLDLYLAATRILEARLEEKGGVANLYPHIDGTATYGHVQYNQNVLNKILGNECEHHNSGKKNLNFYELGFDVEWEIDLFGKQAHEIKALQAQIEASKQDFCYIWATLSAEVAKNYIELRSLQQRLVVLEKNIDAQKDQLKLTESLIVGGFASSIDQKQAQELWNSLNAQKPVIELAIRTTIHRLSILLGHPPGELLCELREPCALPCLPDQMPIGIPSELLRRRPDIRKAERELAAATERIGVSVAAMFPQLSLTGFIGDIGAWRSNGLTWFGGSQLFAPIFNSKELKQDVDYSKIKTRQALYEYQKTVLKALEEVENGIASFHYEWERNRHLKLAEKSSREAYQLTSQLYQKGLKNYLDVLVTDRSLLANEEAYLQSQTTLLLHYISLYKALGGGWCNPSDCNN